MAGSSAIDELRMLDRHDVCEIVRVGENKLCSMISKGEFPKPKNFGERTGDLWTPGQIRKWQAKLEAED